MQAIKDKTTKYPDYAYDNEGYGVSTGIHKRLGVRRYFRPGVDDPLTDEERSCANDVLLIDEDGYNECFRSRTATEDQPWGGHEIEMVSHEESRCVKCGCYFSMPDC